MNHQTGTQTIQCNVASCKHNHNNCDCDLHAIRVQYRKDMASGKACDESLCASYEHC